MLSLDFLITSQYYNNNRRPITNFSLRLLLFTNTIIIFMISLTGPSCLHGDVSKFLYLVHETYNNDFFTIYSFFVAGKCM